MLQSLSESNSCKGLNTDLNTMEYILFSFFVVVDMLPWPFKKIYLKYPTEIKFNHNAHLYALHC